MDVTTTGEISYSQLSKFERGETSITIHHLVNLVHNLGISFAEFMTAIEDTIVLINSTSKKLITLIKKLILTP
ncbi:helix-turn-helix domain-containing protein [Aerococcus viridans]|uniref:helix-turn-helix domain-containing protein n=1 Tax=Aerococcus viridans TaxID=1377 RepID=UPI003AA9BA1B